MMDVAVVKPVTEDVPREMIHIENIGQVKAKPVYEGIKRIVDIIASLAGFSVLWLPMVVIAILIRTDSPGPALFKQCRLGINGKPFYIYKFRSMVNDAEKDGAQWALEEDPRTTRIGKILRKTRMDELPQLLNIFLGQMTIVGPRPERPEFYDYFDTYIDGFRQRLAVKPGLTGYAQVMGGYELLPEEKIIFDLEYIKKRSFKMDLWCIAKTIGIVFSGDGAR